MTIPQPEGRSRSGPLTASIASSGIPRSEAVTLLAHAAGCSRERVLADSGGAIDDAVLARFNALARARAAGEPMAYLTGHREFFGRSFGVDPRVLIPRPDTELLVERAIAWIQERRAVVGAAPSIHVLELGTGSGAIAVSLALECAALAIVACDLSTPALAVARDNAARLGAAVRFVESDWFEGLDAGATFDLVVSNPPYVAAHDAHLDEGDLRFEPRLALTDGADGLSALRQIIAGSRARLAPGGALMVEHGHDQALAVRALLGAAGCGQVASFRDLAGIERVTVGTVHPVAAADSEARRPAL